MLIYIVNIYDKYGDDGHGYYNYFSTLDNAKIYIENIRKEEIEDEGKCYCIFDSELDTPNYNKSRIYIDELLMSREHYNKDLRTKKIKQYQGKLEELKNRKKTNEKYFISEIKKIEDEIEYLEIEH